MTDLLAPWQRVPLPSSWRRPQPDQGVPVGQHMARYLRQASQAVGAALGRILPEAGLRAPVLDLGPWEAAGSVTPGPAGWFALAVEAGRSGFRLGGRQLAAADLARAIWHCPRWRGRPVLLVTQASAPADGAGPVLHQLAVDLGAPVYASDAGIRFTFGRAFAGGMFWCWHPRGGDEPEPVGRLLPPLGPVRARRTPSGRHPYRQPPFPVPSPPPRGRPPSAVRVPVEPVPPPVIADPGTVPAPTDPGNAPLLADPAANALPAAAPESVAGMSPGVEAALGVHVPTVPVIEVPRPDLGVRPMGLPDFQPPRLELDTCRPLATIPPAEPATVAATPLAESATVAATPLAESATVAATPTASVPAPGPAAVDAPANGADAVDVPANGPPPTPPTPRADRRVAAWLGVRARTEEADRERLRIALGWKFQAHSRAVVRALSLHPGLRSAVGTHDVLAGLVAVLALLDGVGERVNGALRGGGTPDEEVQLLARCACAGLVQLPAIGGPVFAALPAGLEVTGRYRPGKLVAEPAFTAVSLTGGTGGDTGGAGRYAIWSATARRLDQLGTPGGPGARSGQAMFAAGTRFAVLGVDDGPDGAPCVLLREIVFEHRDSGLDERVAGKLRDALAAQLQRTAPAPLPWPLGFAAGDRPFALQPGPAGALRADSGGAARPAPATPGGDSHEGVNP
ncbi:hypothetical protein GCM10027290_54810 [Micromonospora sonneratiae]|uniref:Uncharacterized protein n=1 Tax=Micromonospora sonneratiae TaxID=1184706 RepID=A0ABW3YMW0_9ACTN